MNFLFPTFPVKRLPAMIRLAVLGAGVAGLYGMLARPDQLFPFAGVFHEAEVPAVLLCKLRLAAAGLRGRGRLPRHLVGRPDRPVGSWPGWGSSSCRRPSGRPAHVKSFAIMLATAPIIGFLGAMLGLLVTRNSDLSRLARHAENALHQRPALVRDRRTTSTPTGYLGGLLGLILAILYVRKCVRRNGCNERRFVGRVRSSAKSISSSSSKIPHALPYRLPLSR